MCFFVCMTREMLKNANVHFGSGMKKKWQRVKTENLKPDLASKANKPTANPIYLQDSSHSESET